MKQKNNLSFWILVIIVLVLLAWGASKLAQDGDNQQTNNEILKIQSNDWVKGNPEAKLVLIEYSDFQCPACKTAAFYGQQLAADSSTLNQDVAIVFRHFPLTSIHQNAQAAAWAAEAAGLQNKFWEMHDIIFDKQAEWSKLDQAELENTFTTYAESLGLDLEQFKTDIKSDTVKSKVTQNINQGEADQLNISYTPTIYLNGEIINLPNSYDKFRQLLQAKLP